MNLRQKELTCVVAIVCLALICGCSGGKKSGAGAGSGKKSDNSSATGTPGGTTGVSGDDLKQLAIAVHKFQAVGKKTPPKDWQELLEFAGANKLDTTALKRVQDADYTVYWNVKIRDAKVGLGRFVLAYRQKDVAAGGLVLMYSGLPKQVSGEQLKTMLGQQDPTKAIGKLDPVPSGGRLVMLGGGRYALKVIDDRQGDMILAYIVDGTGQKRVALDISKKIMLKMGGQTITFDVFRDDNDPAEKTTRYALVLVRSIETFRKGGQAQFEVEIDGKKLQGSASF